VDSSDLDAWDDAIDRIYVGSLDGMTVRGVFTEAEVEAVTERLWDFRPEFVDHGTVAMLGTAIVGSDDDRDRYHADAPAMNDRLEVLFEGEFRDRIEQVLGRVGGRRPVQVPEDGPHRPYVPATARVLPADGGVIHAHTANEFCDVWPAYAHLREIARMRNSLSYFVLAQTPDAGGDLLLYDLDWEDTPADVRALEMSPERDALLDPFAGTGVLPGPGDMVLFNGGRIWHRVQPVRGEQPRVTVGGFVGLSHDGDTVYYWS
jgi:hapalindole-type alkaloid chlorinase